MKTLINIFVALCFMHVVQAKELNFAVCSVGHVIENHPDMLTLKKNDISTGDAKSELAAKRNILRKRAIAVIKKLATDRNYLWVVDTLKPRSEMNPKGDMISYSGEDITEEVLRLLIKK